MLRSTTPLPRRPSAEAELLDEVLAVFVGHRRGLSSVEVVKAVNGERAIDGRAPAAAVDVRMCLAPPYFYLGKSGRWKCKWELAR